MAAAWAPGQNNYRASVEAMDQRNALGRAFNGMTVLVGYEIPLRRIGAGLFPANENFQPSPFSGTSAARQPRTPSRARAKVYFGDRASTRCVGGDGPGARRRGRRRLRQRAEAALAALDAPYDALPRAARPQPRAGDGRDRGAALTDLGRELRRAGNRLGVLVVDPAFSPMSTRR